MQGAILFLLAVSTLSCWSCTPVSANEPSHSGAHKQYLGPSLVTPSKGIVLIPNKESLLSNSDLKMVEGIQAMGVEVPGGIDGLKRRIMSRYYNQPLDQKKIFALIDEINDYYREHMHPFVVIEIPKQNISSGVLQIVVSESKLGSVRVEGSQRRGTKKILKYVQLKSGEFMDEKVLLKNLQFMNRNPFRHVDYIYTPGEKDHTTDLVLYAEDRRPYRIYAGSDNSGVSVTGRQRWFAGLNVSYLTGLDDNFSYQYTTSSDFHKLQAHTLQYLVLLPWRNLLNTFGGYSSVHADLSFPGGKNHGTSSQFSQRYIIPLNPSRSLNHEVEAGYDYKRMNNDLQFSDVLIKIGKIVNLTQLVGKYAGNFEKRDYRINYDMELYWSPGQWLPSQSNADFQSLRPGAKNYWVYLRSGFNYSQKLSDWAWFISQLRTQLSGYNLLPSEQLGIGGYDTVRGYSERTLNKDSGVVANVEFRTAAMRLFFRHPQPGKTRDGLQFLGFLDYGWGTDHKALPGLPRSAYLAGAGPGMRYTLNNVLAARLDWGFRLHEMGHQKVGDSMLHFQVVLSY